MDQHLARYRDALERMPQFAEAYEAATEEKPFRDENVGWALCITLGRYARKILAE